MEQDEEPRIGHVIHSSHHQASPPRIGDKNTRPLKREHSIENDIVPFKKISPLVQQSLTQVTYENDVQDIELPVKHIPTKPFDNSDITVYPQQSRSNSSQVINIYNTTVENIITTIPSQQRQPDFAGVRLALELHYKNHLQIHLVSGNTLDIEEHYVKPAIIEDICHQQVDGDRINNQLEFFDQTKNFNNTKESKSKSTIQIEELFNLRKLRDGTLDIPKKILIHGRAGIGKTTICKKLVHEFITGEWRDRFEAVLWIPLRELKTFKPQNIEDLVKAKYIPHLNDKNKTPLAEDISTGIELQRVLFIIDGLDEVIQDIQTDIVMDSFIHYLLQQTHVIVTSRPFGVDYSILPTFDLELEMLGFDTTSIKNYVSNILEDEEAKSMMGLIQKTPFLQSLANIPVLLDVMCHSWKSLPKDIDTITITKLYQVMVDKLFCKDATRVGKINNGRAVSAQLVSGSNERRIRNVMSTEIEYLSFLAFDGIKNNRIEFNYYKLNEVVDKLNQFRVRTNGNQLPFDLLEILKQTSFLHSVKDVFDSQDDPSQDSYRFIHITFQDYFASMWLSRFFRTSALIPSNSTAAVSPATRAEAIQFVQNNKYNPRCEKLWWMIAGQLEGEALESFFQLLQTPPLALTRVQHQCLIIGCYKESQSRLPPKLINQLQSEMSQWLWIDIGIKKCCRNKISDNAQSNDILINYIKENGVNGEQLIITLRNRRFLNFQ